MGQRESPTVDLTPSERHQLRRYLLMLENEWSMCCSMADYCDAADEAADRRSLERARLDVEWVDDASLPLTVRQLERWRREILRLGGVLFQQDIGEALAFCDRLQDYCRRAKARVQSVRPIEDPAALVADFWPEDESVDEFIAAVRSWRHEGNPA